MRRVPAVVLWHGERGILKMMEGSRYLLVWELAHHCKYTSNLLPNFSLVKAIHFGKFLGSRLVHGAEFGPLVWRVCFPQEHLTIGGAR